MRLFTTLRILGILLMTFSLSMLPPLMLSVFYGDDAQMPFIVAFTITLFSGVVLYTAFQKYRRELTPRDGFFIVVLFWAVLSLFASIPFMLEFYSNLGFTDAIFEAVSGLTTTGATVLTHLNVLPHSMLYYRMQLHFLGGMGIIVLAVAVMPMLGVGGMQLYRAEVVGPVKDYKLHPRIAQTAKALWGIYVGLVLLCALSYWLAGMPLFDAICESFTTVATGGFSTHDSSFAYYNSSLIDSIAIVFMILGATNFALHFQFLRQRRVSIYFKDPEWKAYIKLLIIVTFITVGTLLFYREFYHGRVFIDALFTVVSIATTTGLTVVHFNNWPAHLPYLIMFVGAIGGCAASTTGGIKMIRALLLKEQSKRELKRLVHPRGVYAIKLGGHVLSESVIQSIWGFVAIFIALFVFLLLLLLATGLDLKTAFGALIACLSNVGATIGKAANGYGTLPMLSKWILMVAMLLGRLEIFTLLVLFTPEYWRR